MQGKSRSKQSHLTNNMNKKTAQPSLSVFLYFPQWLHLQQLIQLPTDEHAFVGFMDHFDFSSYLAHNHQILPLYSAQDVGVNLNQWFGIMGILAVPQNGNVSFYKVFEKEIGGADFLRKVEAMYCQPNSLGKASDVWQLQVLADNHIQFSDSPFPNGFPPPLATIEAVPLSDPSYLIDQDFFAHLSSISPSGGPSWNFDSYDALYVSHDSDYHYPGSISMSVRNEEQAGFSHVPHISESFDDGEYLSEYVPSGTPSVELSWLGKINHASFMVSDHHVEEAFGYPLITPMSIQTREQMISSDILVEQFPVTSPINPMMVAHQALVWKGVDTAIDRDHHMNIYRCNTRVGAGHISG
ncbi:hypothetical protein EV424DRAFT_1549264 [Suillus variegatus]|nr:hypothetical protein EV424DRAFT_1549264 [Suillus variegatus]